MPFRYIAQRLRTGLLLDVDLDFTPSGPPQRELSGPGSLSGTVSLAEGPSVAEDGLPLIDDWSTAIYAEDGSGSIYWGGIVTDTRPSGDRMTVTCAGFAGYPAGIPYLSVYGGFTDGKVDVFSIVRQVWSHLQSFPAGDLGLQVDGAMSGITVGNKAEPYGLVWWDAQDCGAIIDDLARATPFDYLERHTWNADRTRIDHFLDLGYPRIGGRREDLRFAPGENITAMPELDRLTDEYSNEVYAIGKGEGSKSERVSMAYNGGQRLRRVYTMTDKGKTSAQLQPIVRAELSRRLAAEWQIDTLTVRDHPNAPLGSWALGDDIPVTIDQPWAGTRVIWHRVIADQIDLDHGYAVLQLMRSDATAVA